MKQRFFKYAGVAASVVLVVFGAGAVTTGIDGRSTVRDSIVRENIVGSPDMTPEGIAASAKSAGLRDVALPTCSVAGKPIDTGARAECFAAYLRVHALEATGGQVYAEMPRFIGKDGEPTSDAAAAAVDPKSGKPVENGLRNVWITATSLSTALNVSYFAERVAMFAIIVGIALLLTGIGLLVLTVRWMRAPASVADRAASGSAGEPLIA